MESPGEPDTVIDGNFPNKLVDEIIASCTTGETESWPLGPYVMATGNCIVCKSLHEPTKEKCEECGGTGIEKCSCCGQDTDCEECEGAGETEIDGKLLYCDNCRIREGSNPDEPIKHHVVVGSKNVSAAYAPLIEALPGARYFIESVKDNKNRAIGFRFDGGVGAVMPFGAE